MLASSPAAGDAFELLADGQLSEGRFLAGHVALRDAADVRDVEEAKRLVKTAAHLLAAPSDAVYAYAARRHIDLILRPKTPAQPRAVLAHLAAAASARHSLLRGRPALFDAHLYEFPHAELLLAHLLDRRQQAEARLLDDLCARELASSGDDPDLIRAMTPEEKREVVGGAGERWEDITAWRRCGVGLYIRGEDAELVVETELPAGDDYAQFLSRFF